MNILVFGGTGRVGLEVITQALAAGHSVRAFLRTPGKLTLSHERLTTIQGDIHDSAAVEAAVAAGVDAVVNVIGGDVFKPSTVVTDAARVLVPACERSAVGRYLAITGTAEMPSTMVGGIVGSAIRRSPIRHGVLDHDGAYAIVCASKIPYTLVGCPYIKDGPRTGRYDEHERFPGGFKTIHPGDVADCLVRHLHDPPGTQKIVGIWY